MGENDVTTKTTYKEFILEDNQNWEQRSVGELKVILWNNIKYAREAFGIGYIEHIYMK